MENNATLEIIEGTVENIVFQNEQTGYNVLEIDVAGTLVTAVGELGEIFEGERVKLSGNFTAHQTYGTQFRAVYCERNLPKGANDIYKYLASGVIKGVGEKTASAIVAQFGDSTLDVIENTPEKLSSVRGVSAGKAVQIGKDFKKIFGSRSIMKELAAMSVGAGESVRAYKKFGERTIQIVKENPYVLCGEDIGMEFEAVDAIAVSLGFGNDAPCRVRAGILWVMRHNIKNGHTYLPRRKLEEISGRFLSLSADDTYEQLEWLLMSNLLVEEAVEDAQAVFLPEYFACESYIALRITRMLQQQTEQPDDIDTLISAEEAKLGIEYARLQKTAIRQALTQNIIVLTGGPGTGKTTTLNGMISLFEKRDMKVLLAAPTGRAAQRMSEVTGREAKTVHRLLEVMFSDGDIPKFQRNEDNPLKADVVIIDEISMVDVILFASLLKAMPDGCRLVLVGDCDQLPSVGAGRVLYDLCRDDFVPTVRLSEVFRQAAESLIVTNAHLIVKGNTPELSNKENDFFFMKRESVDAVSNTVVDLCSRRLPKAYGVSPMTDIQVLCPGRKGEIGIAELNRKLQTVLNPPSPDKTEIRFGTAVFRTGDKVMQIKNNYDIIWVKNNGENGLGVFNGDIGIITSIERSSGIIRIRFDDREVDYPADLLYELEHAYAVTVHKSQGSEYRIVVIPLFGFFDKLYYRNLLYTAVTRAKEILVIVGDDTAVEKMVRNNRKSERYTALSAFLRRNLEEYEQNGF